ncbi:thioredoxin family protein [Flagellimonas sp. DF-77]|uniref:thioredoxin family protein n=1 Tax=Flagellimonas algarum TaxID=3230298 RepID=UPI0033992960
MNETVDIEKQEAMITKALDQSMDYTTYRDYVARLAREGASSGPAQTEALINYTQLNDRRMNRWDKTLKLSQEQLDSIAGSDRKLTFLVLTESWCGDASPSLPVMNKIVEANVNFDLKIVLRDEHEDLMDRFLTNGARSIPKLLVLEGEDGTVVDTWGPRPSKATAMVKAYKKAHGALSPEFKQELQVWYNKDKGKNIAEDLLGLLALE